MSFRLKNFGAGQGGNIAILTALTLPLILLAAGAGVDFQRWGRQQARLQEFADTLALRGAREFMLANANSSQIENVIDAVANGNLPDDLGVGDFKLAVQIDEYDASVQVDLTQPAATGLILARISKTGGAIKVSSTAVARGGMKVCVVALEERGANAIVSEDRAVLDASPCSILSNSTSPFGINAMSNSRLVAGLICSGGGAGGSRSNYSPAPTTDCPIYPDPLAARTPPAVGSCDYHDFEVGYVFSQGSRPGGSRGFLSSTTDGATRTVESVADLARLPLIEQTIDPGVYCGGLKIKMKARVKFRPGVYVIKDGPLQVGAQSTLDGDYIAFHLVGHDSTFLFEPESKISMSAPKTGALAGILFYEDRSAPLDRVYKIQSKDARRFLGTFYLPRGALEVDTDRKVADSSAYTAIVARRLQLKGHPKLVLNADYAATDVPVPAGVGPVGVETYLRD